MQVEILKEEVRKHGFKLLQSVFLEDGYEVRLQLIPPDEEVLKDGVNWRNVIEENFKKLDDINFEGYVAIESSIKNVTYSLLLVPKSLKEITDFIWLYVERYGHKEDSLIDILGNAVCVLEKAIDRIPQEFEVQKAEAQENFDKFTSVIF